MSLATKSTVNRARAALVVIGVAVPALASCSAGSVDAGDTPGPSTSTASSSAPTSSSASSDATSSGPTRLEASWANGAAAERGTSITARGAAPSAGTVTIERRTAGGWSTVATTKADGEQGAPWTATVEVPSAPSFVEYRADWKPAAGATEGQSVELAKVNVYEKHTYRVRSRGETRTPPQQFKQMVQSTYDDERGWRAANHRFVLVPDEEQSDFTLWLATPQKVPTFSGACSEDYSCRVGQDVIINDHNWGNKTPNFTGDLTTYQQMLLNHETGHFLGLGHRYCSEQGTKAPVMMQQSKGLNGCAPNPWPLQAEIAAAR